VAVVGVNRDENLLTTENTIWGVPLLDLLEAQRAIEFSKEVGGEE
jgi:hypothetical protein